ncbi:MAG: DNA polymerase III subunit delta' [Bacillota bacterium]
MTDLSPAENDLLLRGNHVSAGILRSAVVSARIANAYLLKGPSGAPKEALALRFAQALLCDSDEPGSTGEACGRCWSCRAVSNHGHPDLVEIAKDGNTIKIKASHEMLKEALARPYHSARKVFIVRDAEDMTVEASNALLKVLEEPPAYVTFILTATNVRSIPDTIVSRCQTIPFRKLPSNALVDLLVSRHGVSREDAESVAPHADGDPERALRILTRSGEDLGEKLLAEISRGSPVELAQKYAKADQARRVAVVTDLEIELVRRLRAAIASIEGGGPSAGHRQVKSLYRSIEALRQAKSRLRRAVNPFLTFSALFMDLQRARQEGD